MLKATLDRYKFASGEFGRTVIFYIHDEGEAKFSLAGYTVTLIGAIQLATTPDADQTTNTGKGTFVFTSSTNLITKGARSLRFLLEKAGEKTYSEAIKVMVV